MGKLTVAKIKSLSKLGLHSDGATLYLYVAPRGSKSWVQRLTIDGKRRDIGLGGFPVVGLTEARDKAFENRKLARAGGDPLAEKRKNLAPTFREAAERTFEANRPRWRNAKVEKNWMQQLERHAFRVLGKMRVNQVGREEVLRVLTPIWTEKPETARKIRQRIRAILAWSQAHGFIEHNVAGEAINGALPAQPAFKQHLRALPYGEVSYALATVEASRASMAAKLCLRFTVVTASRSGEARCATWDEINLEAKTWSVPASRMKAGAEHRVPISEAALAVLAQAHTLRDESSFIFPSPARPGHPLSDMALTKVLRDTGLADRATVHGFRSSFRDWCAETGKPRELAEAALAHIVGGVEGAYFRSDLFEQRRVLMQQWSDFLTGKSGKVVKLRG